MRRTLAALVLVLSLASNAFAAQWATPNAQVEKSIVRITFSVENPFTGEPGQAVCTGEVIDNARDYVLTAAHCLGEDEMVDGNLPAEVAWQSDPASDLAVLHVKGIDKPALKPSARVLRRGDEVATTGYGWGWDRPLFRHGWVADVAATVPGLEGPYMVTDNGYIGGMSGGPVYDKDARLVGIVQMGDNATSTGLGKSIGFILSKAGKYFAR